MRFIYTKTFLVFATVLVVIFGLLIMQAKGWLQPVEYAVLQAPRPIAATFRTVVSPIKTIVTTLASLRGLVAENGELKARMAELQLKQVEYDKLAGENELLKNELGFVDSTELNLSPCTVLSVDPQDLSDALIINCGESQGIKVGQAVISNGFLVGKIIYVGNITSTALLITSPQSSVDAKISRNNTEGVLKGSFGSGIVFDLVSQNAEVETTDLLVTAGINDRIPAGILIGEVGQVLSGNNDLFKKMSIFSPVRFKTLQYVFIAQ